MALPANWTEATLIGALENELESVSSDLGMDDLDVVSTAVGIDVPSILGVSSVASVTYGGVADVVKVLTIAKWAAWQKAYDIASVKFDLKAGSADLKQSQIFDHLEKRLGIAYAMASRYAEVQAVVGGAQVVPVPFAGGLSKSAKQARKSNTDYVQPFFTRSLHEPVGVGETE